MPSSHVWLVAADGPVQTEVHLCRKFSWTHRTKAYLGAGGETRERQRERVGWEDGDAPWLGRRVGLWQDKRGHWLSRQMGGKEAPRGRGMRLCLVCGSCAVSAKGGRVCAGEDSGLGRAGGVKPPQQTQGQGEAAYWPPSLGASPAILLNSRKG